MNKALLLLLIIVNGLLLNAQKVDSICFHLYTDSLKKGQHNYINVDGKLSNGRWLPMTSKEITLTASQGTVEGNELIIPPDFSFKKVIVKAVLKSNPAIWIEKTIWIKILPDPELPTRIDMMNTKPSKRNRSHN